MIILHVLSTIDQGRDTDNSSCRVAHLDPVVLVESGAVFKMRVGSGSRFGLIQMKFNLKAKVEGY